MLVPIMGIPESIEEGLRPYQDLFPRSETYEHIKEYCTGMVVLEKPSINRLSQCLVGGPSQSSINKAITMSPWSREGVKERRLELIRVYHKSKGLTVGILDSTLSHHPRGKEKIYGVYKYWDYVEGCYTYGISIVTGAITTKDRCDGFDYRIYHRFNKEEEIKELQEKKASLEEGNKEQLISYMKDLIEYHKKEEGFKKKSEYAVEILEEMEKSEVSPSAYVVDSGLFDPVVIGAIDSHGKPWVADSQKSRIVFAGGKRFNCEEFEKSLPDKAFRSYTIKIRGKERTFWVFTKTVRIKRYGKVRIAIIYTNPNREGNPIFCFTKMLTWDAKKILSVRYHRWDIEPFHEQIKQFLGAEDSQLQTEEGVRNHLTLVFVVNSLLKSLDLRKPIGGLSMDGFEEDVQITFGQRCRRIIFEVFYDLIETIRSWIEESKMTVSEIFEILFRRLLYA